MNWMEERLSRLQRWEGYQHSVESREGVQSKLDANENWHLPRAEIREALSTSAEHLDPRSYPDLADTNLAKEVSAQIGVPSESVIPCAGADQAIDLICQAFLGPGDNAVIVSPTFSMYRLRAIIAGAECACVQMLPDLGLPVAEILRRGGPGGGVVGTQLECDPPAQRRVFRRAHNPRTAPAEQAEQPVPIDHGRDRPRSRAAGRPRACVGRPWLRGCQSLTFLWKIHG